MTDYGSMEAKWQARWQEAGLDKAERIDGKPKFMIIFAYPGVTGYLHVGHLRGYTYVDAIGRYKRMTGYNVLFPVGTHATGNGGISLATKIARRDEKTIDYLLRNGCPEDKIPELEKPMSVIEFFNDVYVNEYWKRFGFLADWRRFTCTLYPDYGKFIQWQFHKLKDAGLLIQKPYYAPFCPNCGPVAVDPSETDISKGGRAETQEYTLLKFRHGDEFLVAATLRPETVYGQVCFWVNPEVEYRKIKKDGETWIVSPQAAEKLALQKDGIEEVGTIPGSGMIGWMCEAPMIHREIPVFPASFCNPDVGTGLVTSVPSDAPDDWISLEAVKKDPSLKEKYGLTQELIDSVVPISIIDIKGYGDFPAKDMIERLGITAPGDPKLVEAKKQVYKDGYHMGRMKDVCGEFAGMRVDEAKDKMRQAMIDAGEAEPFHDLSEEVVCRCGARVYIRRIDDQWFINYGDADLTERTKAHAKEMDLNPPEFSENVQGILDWFRERACVRLGNWLGTRFPFDEKWIIEAISDSTLYPIYYTISLYANDHRIEPEQMTVGFFDYVVLGKGDIADVSRSTGVSEELLDRIRGDVLYWYPLDINLGGKEHMTVHFPAFLFNHMAILPDEMQPRGITVNWYVTGKNSDKIRIHVRGCGVERGDRPHLQAEGRQGLRRRHGADLQGVRRPGRRDRCLAALQVQPPSGRDPHRHGEVRSEADVHHRLLRHAQRHPLVHQARRLLQSDHRRRPEDLDTGHDARHPPYRRGAVGERRVRRTCLRRPAAGARPVRDIRGFRARRGHDPRRDVRHHRDQEDRRHRGQARRAVHIARVEEGGHEARGRHARVR